MLTVVVFREFYVYGVGQQLRMTNKASYLQWQWKGVPSNCLTRGHMTRFLLVNHYLAFGMIYWVVSHDKKGICVVIWKCDIFPPICRALLIPF